MKSLHEIVRETIERHRMLGPGDHVAAGVSGGADSVALLLLLDDLRAAMGIPLAVLHFNHQLRGREADADEAFVAALAAQRGLEFVSAREDVAARAEECGWNLEDAARRLRYEFFSRVVESGRATRVAVAHTADDQAETVLAHLVRGTGPAGLAAIYPVVGHVVRPVIEVRREALREFLRERKQPWREDLSNRDTSRLRARIRHELLPVLERDFQPRAVERLGTLAALAREDEAFWTALVADRQAALVERTAQGHAIRIRDLLVPFELDAAAPEPAPQAALTKRLIRRIYQALKGDRKQLGALHVEQVLHLATACESGHRVELPGGIIAERSFDRLIFFAAGVQASRGGRETETDVPSYEYCVELSGARVATVSIPEIGRRFCLKVIDWPTSRSDTKMQANTLDADRLRAPLILRNWRPGDCYRPRGHQRHSKLKRLLQENRVARGERAKWPVLTSAGSVAWARGLPPAAQFAAQKDTKAGVVIVEEML